MNAKQGDKTDAPGVIQKTNDVRQDEEDSDGNGAPGKIENKIV